MPDIGHPARRRWLLALTLPALIPAAWLLLRAPRAPPLHLTSLDGVAVDLPALEGRVVLVNFWATTCNFCREEMPLLARTWRDYHDRGLEMVAVAMSYDRPDWVVGYARGAALPFPVALDPLGSAARAFGEVQATPTLLLIGRDGRLRARYVGRLDPARLRRDLEAELQVRPAASRPWL